MIQNQKRESFVFDWDRNRLTNPLKPANFADICSYSSAFQSCQSSGDVIERFSEDLRFVCGEVFFVPTSVVKSLSENKTLSTGFNLTPGQSLAIPWNHQLLLRVLLSGSTDRPTIQYPTLQNAQSWNLICEFESGLTFKGFRCDRPEGGAPLASAPVFAHTAAQTPSGFNECYLNDNPIEHISEVS